MGFERRKHLRFSATAFLGRSVQLAPLPPYFGYPLDGRLVDLSSGGMAIFIEELIPPEVEFALTIAFPDGPAIQSPVKVRYAYRKGKGYLHGIEFLALPEEMAARLNRMSMDYVDCESRIQAKEAQPCRLDCGFFQMCRKKQKALPTTDAEQPLNLTFRASTPKTA